MEQSTVCGIEDQVHGLVSSPGLPLTFNHYSPLPFITCHTPIYLLHFKRSSNYTSQQPPYDITTNILVLAVRTPTTETRTSKIVLREVHEDILRGSGTDVENVRET